MKLEPFRAADHLDSEEAIDAYLEDARAHGPSEHAAAVAVVEGVRGRRRAARLVNIAAMRTHVEHRVGMRVMASVRRSEMSGKTTSSKAASSAGKTLSSEDTGSKSKSAAGSALSQKESSNTKDTGSKAATNASKTLSDGRTSKDSKSAAGSALAQKK